MQLTELTAKKNNPYTSEQVTVNDRPADKDVDCSIVEKANKDRSDLLTGG